MTLKILKYSIWDYQTCFSEINKNFGIKLSIVSHRYDIKPTEAMVAQTIKEPADRSDLQTTDVLQLTGDSTEQMPILDSKKIPI